MNNPGQRCGVPREALGRDRCFGFDHGWDLCAGGDGAQPAVWADADSEHVARRVPDAGGVSRRDWAHLVMHLSPFVFLPALLVRALRHRRRGSLAVLSSAGRDDAGGRGVRGAQPAGRLRPDVRGAERRAAGLGRRPARLSTTCRRRCPSRGVRFTANRLVAVRRWRSSSSSASSSLLQRDAARQGGARDDAVADRRAARRHRHASGCIRLVFGVGLALAGVAGCAAVDGLRDLAVDGRALHGHRADRHHARRLRQRRRQPASAGLLLGVVEALGMHFTSPSLKMLLSYGVFIARAAARGPTASFAR